MARYDAVVTDAGPLISLEKLPNGFALLEHTCAKLLLPQAVAAEVSYFFPDEDAYFAQHRVREFIEVEVVTSTEITLHSGNDYSRLGEGERSAIALALELQIPLLVEERLARRLARERGLRVFGAAAIIKIACEEKGISSERGGELLRSLFDANRINRKVLRHLLRGLEF